MWGIIVLGNIPSHVGIVYGILNVLEQFPNPTRTSPVMGGAFQGGIKGDFPGRPQIGFPDLCERLLNTYKYSSWH